MKKLPNPLVFLGALLVALLVQGCDSDGKVLHSADAAPPPPAKATPDAAGMVLIPGGDFRMGDEHGLPHEMPVHEVHINAFYLDAHELTNAEFARFVKATNYVTDAQRWGWSIAYDTRVAPDDPSRERVPGAEWWFKAPGADWRHPAGTDLSASIEGKDNYPVVQVSWSDAQAYCAWAGKRLPTEAEWEYAARGGIAAAEFPWGNDFAPEGKPAANTWQGSFPDQDQGGDGFRGLAPVGSFKPNGYGLFDMSGNVWEWVQDWYDARYYERSPRLNPPGPDSGAEKIMRGGSWMCCANYCKGYRVSHRNKATPDSGLNNTGFRCALTLSK